MKACISHNLKWARAAPTRSLVGTVEMWEGTTGDIGSHNHVLTTPKAEREGTGRGNTPSPNFSSMLIAAFSVSLSLLFIFSRVFPFPILTLFSSCFRVCTFLSPRTPIKFSWPHRSECPPPQAERHQTFFFLFFSFFLFFFLFPICLKGAHFPATPQKESGQKESGGLPVRQSSRPQWISSFF